MHFAVRNFRNFKDWAEYDGSRITVLAGPASSGKSALVEALLLLRAQADIWSLSFLGEGRGPVSFQDAVRGHDERGIIQFRIWTSVDALRAILGDCSGEYESVDYPMRVDLSYGRDGFSGSTNGILSELRIFLLGEGSEETELFSISRDVKDYELRMNARELLCLPFVFERLVTEDSRALKEAELARFDRAATKSGLLKGHVDGRRRESVARLVRELGNQKRIASVNLEFMRLLREGARDEEDVPLYPIPLRKPELSKRVAASETKYLRSLADDFIRESLRENGISSLLSRMTGSPIRLSFYSLFYELLAALRVKPLSPPEPFPYFDPLPGGQEERKRRVWRLAKRAEEDYAARLRDAINEASRSPDADGAPEEGGLAGSYLRTVTEFREANPGKRLLAEGGALDPEVLDLEGRRERLRDLLSAAGIADDIGFATQPPGSAEIILMRDSRPERLENLGGGARAFVLLASSLLFAPWGSEIVLDGPEADLDPPLQARLADLFFLLARHCGTSVVAETRSAHLARRLRSLTAEKSLDPGEAVFLICGGGEAGAAPRRARIKRDGGLDPDSALALLEGQAERPRRA